MFMTISDFELAALALQVGGDVRQPLGGIGDILRRGGLRLDGCGTLLARGGILLREAEKYLHDATTRISQSG